MKNIIIKISLIFIIGVGISIGGYSQCPPGSTDANLAHDILTIGPNPLTSCAKAKVTCAWITGTTTAIDYETDKYRPILTVGMPTEFLLSTGTVTVEASDGNIYWDLIDVRGDEEVWIYLDGDIPPFESIVVTITDMDIEMSPADNSKLISVLATIVYQLGGEGADCNPMDDEEFYETTLTKRDGPEITGIDAACTEDMLGIDITVQPDNATIEEYMWSGPNGFTSTDEDPTADIAETVAANQSASGEYTVIVTDENECRDTASINLDGTNCEELPVRYKEFTAKAEGNDGILKWVTSSEINNDRFEVLRSFDGVNFAYIGEVNGSGTTNVEQNYSYIDVNAGGLSRAIGRKVYYRLNQIDFDGKSELSGIRVITFNGEESRGMVVYPNPARNNTYVDLGSECNNCTMKIYNTIGQEVDHLSYQGAMSVETKSLLPGSYMIHILTDGGYIKGAHRLIKAN